MSASNRMNSRWRSLINLGMTAAVLVLLSSCMQTAPARESSAPSPEQIDLGRLLEEVAALQQTEAETLREASAGVDYDDPSELMGWALVMSTLGKPADKVRATELLTAYLDHPGQAPGSIMLATLLLERLQSELMLKRELGEAIRQRDQRDRQALHASTPKRDAVATPDEPRNESETRTLTDAIRERDEAAAQLEEVNEIKTRTLVKTIRERNQVAEQLEKLKAIERQMSDRPRTPDIELPR
jgi:hypothetical protein